MMFEERSSSTSLRISASIWLSITNDDEFCSSQSSMIIVLSMVCMICVEGFCFNELPATNNDVSKSFDSSLIVREMF